MIIRGPAGELEAQLDVAKNEKAITAALCHPHPQYGGSMHDAVLQTVATALLSRGVNCLRFNFRGVGGSDGRFDNGVGEAEDLRSVCEWIALEYPRDKLWLAGYSFGASIVWQTLADVNPARVLLVAPPVGRMDFSRPAPDGIEIHAVAGDRDDFVDLNQFETWTGVTTTVIAGADHFFASHQAELAEAVEQAIA